jgi:hypothetical protein
MESFFDLHNGGDNICLALIFRIWLDDLEVYV